MQNWKGAEMKRIIYRIFDRYLRKKAIENHRKMWRWLAEHPNKPTLEYIDRHDPKREIYCNCYLCDYVKNRAKRYKTSASCDHCPLDWDGRECNNEYSLHEEWCYEQSIEKLAEIARQIAELPERKEK